MKLSLRGAAFRTALVLLIPSCATVPAHGPSAPFTVSGNVDDATVWVDDRMAGTALDFAPRNHRRIAAGFHRLEIRHTGHYSLYRELEVQPNVPQTIPFTLREVLP